MGTYLMMLYVSLEQEKAVKTLFNSKGWGFKKPDLSMTTDKLGPLKVDDESESEEEVSGKGRTKSQPATREASKRTAAVKTIKPSPPAPKSAKKTSKVRVQLRKGGKKSAENAEFQEILEEAELITASINQADEEGDGEESEPFTVKVERDVMESSDYDGEDGEFNEEDIEEMDDYDDVTPSTSYLEAEADAESTDMSQMTIDTPKPAKRRKVTTKARERPTLPPVDLEDLEAMGDLSPIKNNDALDIRDELGFITQQPDVEAKDDTTFAATTEEDPWIDRIDDVTKGPKPSNKSSLKGERFQCDDCGKTYSTKWNLRDHERIHRGDGEECSICGKIFSKESKLKLHVSTAHFGVRFNCDDCDAAFMSPSGLGRHRREKHEDIMYECEECGLEYRSMARLNAHITSKHKIICKHICSQCSKGFRNKQDYVDHMSMHAGLKHYGCHKCGKYFTGSRNLRRHLLLCSKSDKDFMCSQCGVKFKVLRYLNDHVKQVHGEREFGCHRCGKLFISKQNFRKHIKVCGMTDLDFECSQCSKLFKTKGYLQEHVKQMHTNRLTAKCSECGEMFRFRSALHRHKKKTGHK